MYRDDIKWCIRNIWVSLFHIGTGHYIWPQCHTSRANVSGWVCMSPLRGFGFSLIKIFVILNAILETDRILFMTSIFSILSQQNSVRYWCWQVLWSVYTVSQNFIHVQSQSLCWYTPLPKGFRYNTRVQRYALEYENGMGLHGITDLKSSSDVTWTWAG